MNSTFVKLIGIVLMQLAIGCSSPKEEAQSAAPKGMVLIPGGTYTMGGRSDHSSQDEFPRHEETVSPFYMDATEVTNAQFAEFVNATGYVTTAEKDVDWEELKKQVPPGTAKPPDSRLSAGSLVFRKTSSTVNLNDYSQWWKWTKGANWRHPEGPESSIDDRMDHPVVQVSWYDAQAYAEWAGKRLPTEAEWEWAASAGSSNVVYPWGNEPAEQATDKANFWQGFFPYDNQVEDGFEGTAPVKSFPANKFGLYDMAGNVWEWCDGEFTPEGYIERVDDKIPGKRHDYLKELDPATEMVIRGGSFLCNDSYCSGYRVSRRMGSTMDSGLNHTGFRCVRDVN